MALSRYLQARANAVPGKMLSPHFLPSGAPQKLGFDADRLERLHRGMKRFVETGRHAGVSMLLVRDGQVADSFATGFRNREHLPYDQHGLFQCFANLAYQAMA